jgi:hypothetical protein
MRPPVHDMIRGTVAADGRSVAFGPASLDRGGGDELSFGRSLASFACGVAAGGDAKA